MLWPAGIGRIGDHGQAAAGHRAGDHRVFGAEREVMHLGGEIGDGGVVVEGGEDRRAEHEHLVGQRRDHRGDPPSLAAAVNHQAREEKADQHGAAQQSRILVVAGGRGEGDEKQKAADEQARASARYKPSTPGTTGGRRSPTPESAFPARARLAWRHAVLPAVRPVGTVWRVPCGTTGNRNAGDRGCRSPPSSRSART